jgi:hypothetical protein
MLMSCMMELLELQCLLPVKFSPTSGKKLNITLNCHATSGVYIENRSAHKKLGQVQSHSICFTQ